MLKQEKCYCHNSEVITNPCNQRKGMRTILHPFIKSTFMYSFEEKKLLINNFDIKIEVNDKLNKLVK